MAETMEKGANEPGEICRVCGKPIDECVCCPECGHVCPLDAGEDYCPVCSPKEP